MLLVHFLGLSHRNYKQCALLCTIVLEVEAMILWVLLYHCRRMYCIPICVLTLNLTLCYVFLMLEESSLALEICLQKIVYIESLVTTKKSQEPSILFSSVVFWRVPDV